jgi:hypothetical protein
MCDPIRPAASVAGRFPPCPPWCDPRYCLLTESDVVHRSVPVRVATVGAHYEMALIRADELAFGQEWDRPPSLRLSVESQSDGVTPLFLCTDLAAPELWALLAALAGQAAVAGGAS